MKRKSRRKHSHLRLVYDVASASAETIGYRSVLIGKELANPTGFANPEFAAMGQEKLVVAGQSATAMLRRLGGGPNIWSDFWFQQLRRSNALMPQLAGSPDPVRLMRVATESVGNLMSDCFAFWMKASDLSGAVANAGAKPIRRKVMSNAKRLGRVA